MMGSCWKILPPTAHWLLVQQKDDPYPLRSYVREEISLPFSSLKFGPIGSEIYTSVWLVNATTLMCIIILLQICEPQHICEWFVIQHVSVVGHQGSNGYNTPEMKPCEGDITFPETQLWKSSISVIFNQFSMTKVNLNLITFAP